MNTEGNFTLPNYLDKDLNYEYAHRFAGSFSSGAFWEALKGYEKQLEKIIHECIVFKE